MGYSWVSTRSLVVSHQDDQVPIREKLHRAKAYTGRYHFLCILDFHFLTIQAVTHPVGIQPDLEIMLLKVFLRFLGQLIPFAADQKGNFRDKWNRIMSLPGEDTKFLF